MSSKAPKNCPACKGPGTLEYTGHSDYRFSIGNYDPFVCRDCGFVAEFRIKEKPVQPSIKEERDYDW